MAEGQPRDPSERRRRSVLSAMIILLAVGAGAIEATAAHQGAWRPIEFIKIGAILLLAFVLAVRSTTAMRLGPRNPALDDELTRANRGSAAGWGFWALMLALLGVFIASFRFNLTIIEMAPLLLVGASAVAGMRFVFLERQG